MKFLKNIILLVIVLALSYFTAEYFGILYDKFSPQYSNSFLGTDNILSLLTVGIPFAYIFFTILGFQTLGSGNRNLWTIILLIPPTLFWIALDINHIYLPVILGLVAFVVSKIINKRA